MNSISKKVTADAASGLDWIISELEQSQESDPSHVLFGNYASWRYHPIFPLRRQEDNVFFVSWITQLLVKYIDFLAPELQARTQVIIDKGNKAIAKYRNRYGELTYNFYRPNAWFPNGRILSRFNRFQPTDDTDDTAIACRALPHGSDEARKIKEIFKAKANGKSGRSLKRLPHKYRNYACYSTWIGSEQIYVDTDLVVLSNILIFNASYDLGIEKEDSASLLFIKESVLSADYLRKKWSLAAWYPSDAVILYSLADLIALEYYQEIDDLRKHLIADLKAIQLSKESRMERLMTDSALMKLGMAPRFDDSCQDFESVIESTKDFSFGVIPLLHPFQGLTMQFLGSFKLTQLHYESKAQRLSILLEYQLLLNIHSLDRNI